MELFTRELGAGGAPLVVCLHGVLGQSRNWRAAGAGLASASGSRVVGLDLRGHGESPGGVVGGFDELVADVLETVPVSAGPVVLIGHSLGGKVAMRLACRHASRVAGVVVVDIAPREYFSRGAEVEAMAALDLASLRSRKEADSALAAAGGGIPDRRMRQFLLTNLVRTADGSGFRWLLDLEMLRVSMSVLRGACLDATDRYDGPVLWALGGRSRYVEEGDAALMARHFARVETVRLDAGHNVHVDDRSGFVSAVSGWMRSL